MSHPFCDSFMTVGLQYALDASHVEKRKEEAGLMVCKFDTRWRRFYTATVFFCIDPEPYTLSLKPCSYNPCFLSF
jgi:hypothetical protein